METWDADAQGWTLTDDTGGAPEGGLTVPAGFGEPSPRALRVDADVGDPPPPIDRLRTDGSGATYLAGSQDYTTWEGFPRPQYIWFNFYNEPASAPAGLQLFFESGASPGATWYYNLDTAGLSSGSWHSFMVPMFGSEWYDLGSGGTWANDIVDVDEIGIRITYLTNVDDQVYGLDSFRRGYLVPEPGTYAALGFAFASLGMTFRRRLNDVVGHLFKRG
jgi:hypothetical protein